MVGVTCLLLSLVWGGTEYPWGSPVIVGLALTGAVVVVGFVVCGRLGSRSRFFRCALFRSSIFSISSALGVLTGAGLFGGIIFLPLFLQVVMGVTATDSGLLLLPLTAGIVTSSVGSGRIISHTGRYRAWPIGGLALATVGMGVALHDGSDDTALAGIGLHGHPGVGRGRDHASDGSGRTEFSRLPRSRSGPRRPYSSSGKWVVRLASAVYGAIMKRETGV